MHRAVAAAGAAATTAHPLTMPMQRPAAPAAAALLWRGRGAAPRAGRCFHPPVRLADWPIEPPWPLQRPDCLPKAARVRTSAQPRQRLPQHQTQTLRVPHLPVPVQHVRSAAKPRQRPPPLQTQWVLRAGLLPRAAHARMAAQPQQKLPLRRAQPRALRLPSPLFPPSPLRQTQ